MDIRSLLAYITVADTLHFGAAAKKLNLTQPSLSARIKKLEDELGFALFERSSSGVRLTDQGEILRSNAEKLIEDWNDTKSAAASLKNGNIDVLRIGVTDIGLFSDVPQIIRDWNKQNADVKVELFVGNSHAVEKQVSTSRTDIGFFHPPAEFSHLSTAELFGAQNVVALPDHHPLSGEESLNLGQLADERFILIKRSVGPSVYDRTIAGCVHYGFSPNIIHEVDNSIIMVGYVAIGVGVGLTIAPMASMSVSGVVYVPLEPSHPLPFGLCWRPGFYENIAKEFIDISYSVTEMSE